MSSLDFSSMQLDAIKEVGNIGIGNAATALSTMINKKVDMAVPSVNIIPLKSLLESMYGKEVVIGTTVKALGDAPGNILFILKKDTASEIIETLTGMKDDDFGELGQSVLCEIGNIISCSYMNAISEFTNLVITASPPKLTFDTMHTLLKDNFEEAGQSGESVLDIETKFLQDSQEISGHFYFIPEPGALEKILNTLGMN